MSGNDAPAQKARGLDYRAAGVDIAEADRALDRIRPLVDSTRRPEVLSDVGHFGGLFRLDASRFRRPVLVASTDGVGTKLRLAREAGRHEVPGHDLVSHCINDILVQGAEPLFFLDYLAMGRLDAAVAEGVVRGIAAACREFGIALLGGETAEMPGFYPAGDYDLAGTIVGVVEEDRIVDGRLVAPGDVLIGLPSSGLHTNGYSLARAVLRDRLGLGVRDLLPGLGISVADAFLAPHRCYLPVLRPHLREGRLHALAHITGGGISDNLARVLPSGVLAEVDLASFRLPPLFRLLAEAGRIVEAEMLRAFQLRGRPRGGGGGFRRAGPHRSPPRRLPPRRSDRGRRTAHRTVPGPPRMTGKPIRSLPAPGRRLGVLISGRGSNLKAILDAVASGSLDATVALVLSNRRAAAGLSHAESAGAPTTVLSHRAFPDRESYDRAVLERLRAHRVDVVCLAGFMRILSPVLLDAFPDRVLNIHPSLLPAFGGLDAPVQALDYGVRIAGCTVHLVDELMDHGPIVLQEAVPVHDEDTPETLSDRILALEHRLYPRAIGLLLEGGLRLQGRRVLLSLQAASHAR